MIKKGKRSKTLNEVKSVANRNKNPEIVLAVSPAQNAVSPTYKLQGHVFE